MLMQTDPLPQTLTHDPRAPMRRLVWIKAKCTPKAESRPAIFEKMRRGARRGEKIKDKEEKETLDGLTGPHAAPPLTSRCAARGDPG